MKQFLKFTLASIVGVLVAGLLLLFVTIGVITAMVSGSDEPVQSESNSVLLLKFDHQIVDRARKNPLEGLDFGMFQGEKTVGLNDMLDCIRKAKTDHNILGIYLNPMDIQAGMATVEEIRTALKDFKTSGKFIYAYGDAFSQKAYYLVTVADSLMLNPQGSVDFRGLGGERTFYKKGLEKLGVEMQIIRHGKFKSAVEPFLLDKMSPENRLQTETYMKSMWNEMLTDISASRKMGFDELNDIADAVATFRKADFAKQKNLVDRLKYKDQVIDDLKRLTNTDAKDDVKAIDIYKYIKVPDMNGPKTMARKKIAVIYASGDIDSGTSEDDIKSEDLSRTIREARRDSSIKAIVLRINSPGGSAYGSDVIWREVKLAAQAKPLIASMGDVAASGGYYIACAADTIMADRTTITGSIGIFGMIPNFQNLLTNKLGITQDVVTTNEHSDMISVTRPMSAFERDLMQQTIEAGYDTFISRVAEGRKMDKTAVDDIGQGRVWAATNAKEIKLVDVYGGLTEAIELAKKMAKLDSYRIVNLPKLKDPIEELMKEFTGSAKARFMMDELGETYKYYDQLRGVVAQKGILTRVPYDIEIH
ncbi:protease IV [Aquipluma nitroreducens]|uniref:Protease IV n=1 Tax=Aquipluma nitroreducens TaxID=2010828 RepID=A0A5K7S7W5_9BACT|nr:signal peptide peptidase SppA [Aquipluma nitroreducens]BBE17642.1 protease IV [Aquipluma nitroreducens]